MPTINPIHKVYIAAPYPLKKEAAQLAAQCQAAGLQVMSHWHHLPDTAEETLEEAEKDLAEIDESDAVVLINPKGWADKGTGGRHFECGWACRGGILLVVVGVPTNIFHKRAIIVDSGWELVRVLKGAPA